MTRDDIIHMAKEANLVFREDFIEMASKNSEGVLFDDLIMFTLLVAKAEREACARLCHWHEDYATGEPNDYANLIRGRKTYDF